MTEAETGKRPKPIELLCQALFDAFEEHGDMDGLALQGGRLYLSGDIAQKVLAEAAFSVLTKHGCISIEGIIARDEEMGTDVRKT